MGEHLTRADSAGRWFDRTTAFAAAGYLGLLVLLFHRLLLGAVLSPAANLFFEVPFRSVLGEDLTRYLNGVEGDVWRQFEPWHRYQYAAARAGRFPLWNPHIFCGMPFHANAQSAMLSPFHWVYFVLDPKWAAGPVAALKLWVAGFAAFCLGRRLGMIATGAFLAGAAWMLCAFQVRWLLWNHSTSAAWLPVVLLALDRLVDHGTCRRIAVAGLAATALQLSGHPESQFHVGALAGLYVLVRVALQHGSSRQRGRVLLACLLAQVLGVLGAAASLLPFVERAADSVDWQTSLHALQRTLPADRLLGLVAPDHFGRPRAGRWYSGPLNYIEVGCYIGLIPLALVVTGVVGLAAEPRRTAATRTGVASVVFSLWLLLCGAVVLGVPGVFELVHRLPLFAKADNLRLLLGVQFAGAMLAGAAWTQLSERADRLQSVALRVAACAIALVVLWLLVSPRRIGTYNHWEGLTQLWTDPKVPAPFEHRSVRTVASLGFAVAGAVWAFGIGVWSRIGSAASRPALVWAGGLLLASADLVWVAYDFNPAVPRHIVFPAAPEGLRRVAEHAREGRILATDEILAPNVAMLYGLRDVRGYDYPIDVRLAQLFERLDWQVGFTYLPRRDVVPCVRPEVQSVCDKLAVRFLYSDVVQPNLPVSDSAGIAARPAWPLVQRGVGRAKDAVYQNPTAYPRTYFARHVRTASPDDALRALLDQTHDLRHESFVETPVGELHRIGPMKAPGAATIEFDGDEEVIVRTQSRAAGLLVLSDRYDPNWRVTIDGTRATALRTNYLFRGVVVPAGPHVVRWLYRPTSFRWGCVISVLTVIGMAAVAIDWRRFWRRANA